jgi:dCTP deaminase
VRAEREPGDEHDQDAESHQPPNENPSPSRACTPTPTLVRVDRLEHGQAADPNALRENRAVVLSDRTIRRLLAEGRIAIDPFDETLLQPSSVDVRVDRYFRVFRNSRYPYINVKEEQEDLTELVQIDGGQPFILHPGEFVLGSTLERVTLPDDLVARLEGKSSLGRLGLLIHSTAGFIDPGWDGHVTLELSNVANLPITIYHGMKIGQLSFVQLSEPAETPYGASGLGSKYQGQQGPTPSRYWQNFREDESA